jgi:hypothetical protein
MSLALSLQVREALRTDWSFFTYACDSSDADRDAGWIARRCRVAEDILKSAGCLSWDDRLWISLKCGFPEHGSSETSEEWGWIAEQGDRGAHACITLLDQHPVVTRASTARYSHGQSILVMPLSNQLLAVLAVFRKNKYAPAAGHVLRMLDLWMFKRIQMDGRQTSGTENADLIRLALEVLRAVGSLQLAQDLLVRFLARIVDSSDAYLYDYRWLVDALSEVGGDDVVLALHSALTSLELKRTENDSLYEGWASLVLRAAGSLKCETLKLISAIPKVHHFINETQESDQARVGRLMPVDTSQLQELIQSELRRRCG